jgi:UDP-2,3-diacylglucosamine hydrolase
MRQVYFVSDIHFGLQQKSKEQEKLNLWLLLFEEIKQNGRQLFLVGDILDYWMEYKHVVPKGHIRFFNGLLELTQNGIEVYYLAGNHDFYLGSYFEQEMGVKTIYGQFSFEYNNKTFILAHGDGVGKGDLGYKLFRTLIRNGFNVKLFKLIHPDLGVGLMNYLSRLSRKHTYAPTDYGNQERLYIYANELLKNQQFDYFIAGHRHVAKLLPLNEPGRFYVNLGTWIDDQPTYATYDESGMHIINIKNREVIFSEPWLQNKEISQNIYS